MTDTSKNLSQAIRQQMRLDGKRFWAGDNVSEYIEPYQRDILIE